MYKISKNKFIIPTMSEELEIKEETEHSKAIVNWDTSDHIYAKQTTTTTTTASTVQKAMKRKAGRPEREAPIKVAEVPWRGPVPFWIDEEKLRVLKHQRARDLNTEASKRFRINKKKKQQMMERECESLEKRKNELTQKLLKIESEIATWKERCRSIGHLDFTFDKKSMNNIDTM